MADRNKLGAAMMAAKSGKSSSNSSISVDNDVSTKLTNRQLVDGLGLDTNSDKPTTITIRLPSSVLKSLWQVRAKQDGITLTDAIVDALSSRWGGLDD